MSHESVHSSSSSSSSSLDSPAFLAAFFCCVRCDCLGTGGPQAMLNIRHFTLSKRREWVKVSCATERIRTVPSSHPSARDEEDGLAEMDHIAPPCELMVLCLRE